LQPDDLVSNPFGSQSWNRYSYVSNSPIIFNDPTGHMQINDGESNRGSNCHGQFAKYCSKGKPLSRELLSLRHEKGASCSDPNPPIVCRQTEDQIKPDLGFPITVAPSDIPDLQELEDWAWFTDKTLEFIDYASSYEDIINTTRPVYKQVKYAWSTGGIESIIDAVIYGVKDRWSTSLSPEQRMGRMVVVGAQSFAVDQLSNQVGKLGIPFGGKAGEVAVQYIFSAAVSEYAGPTTTYFLFDNLNLGVPINISALLP